MNTYPNPKESHITSMECFGKQHLHPESVFRFLDRMDMDPNLFWVLFPDTNSESGIIIKDVGYN